MANESLHNILLSKVTANEDDLPIIHATKIRFIPQIFGSGVLKCFFDDTLKKEAVFFFYGRSAYRFKNGEKITDLSSSDEIPIVFVFPTSSFKPDMIHPFDTGGFARDDFRDDYRNLPNRAIQQYELSDYSDVKKFIHQLYGNNEGYIGEKAHSFKCSNKEEETMINDIVDSINHSKTKQTKTIEIKSFNDVNVSSCSAVVVPTQVYRHLDNKNYKPLKDFCDAHGIKIIQYYSFGSYKLSEINAVAESKVYEYEYGSPNGEQLCN